MNRLKNLDEVSYIDILIALREEVEEDKIFPKEKDIILKHIEKLENLLFKYSA